MKKVIYSLLLVLGVAGMMASCSNGDYSASPTSNGNSSINPLNPLKANQFTWSGTKPLSVNVNGNLWVADTALFYYNDSSRTAVIEGWTKYKFFEMYINGANVGQVAKMGYNNYSVLGIWWDDSARTLANAYSSALGNSGELLLTLNDSVQIGGQFYFQGINPSGNVYNFTDGYFLINKF
jgi:Family of unknown function (DUF6252)